MEAGLACLVLSLAHFPSRPDGHDPEDEDQQKQEPVDTVKVNVNDPKILSFSVKYLDKTETGEVPVGGEFEIK